MSHVVIMADAKIEIGKCVSNVTLPVLTRPADTPSEFVEHIALKNLFLVVYLEH